MSRTWVYQRMSGDATLATMVGDRIYGSTSLTIAPHIKPFIIYRQTSEVSGMRGDGRDATRNTGFMVFVHDLPGDYLVIDGVMDQLRTLFQDVNDPDNSIVRCEWLETADDYRDDDMGTIMKFARIQVVTRHTD